MRRLVLPTLVALAAAAGIAEAGSSDTLARDTRAADSEARRIGRAWGVYVERQGRCRRTLVPSVSNGPLVPATVCKYLIDGFDKTGSRTTYPEATLTLKQGQRPELRGATFKRSCRVAR